MFGSTSPPLPATVQPSLSLSLSWKTAPSPAFRSTCHAILSSRDEFAARGDLPGETRYSQFRPTTVAGIEGAGGRPSSFSSFPLTSLRRSRPIVPRSPSAFLAPRDRIVRSLALKPNFFCFSSCLLPRSINSRMKSSGRQIGS